MQLGKIKIKIKIKIKAHSNIQPEEYKYTYNYEKNILHIYINGYIPLEHITRQPGGKSSASTGISPTSAMIMISPPAASIVSLIRIRTIGSEGISVMVVIVVVVVAIFRIW